MRIEEYDGMAWALPDDQELLADPGKWSLCLRMGTVAARMEQAMLLAEALGIQVIYKAQIVKLGELSFCGGFPFTPKQK